VKQVRYTYEIWDFCGLHYENGIFVHFEWMNTNAINEDGTVDSTRSDDSVMEISGLWDFFYQKRRDILKNINDGALLPNWESEDFAGKVTDRNFELVLRKDNKRE